MKRHRLRILSGFLLVLVAVYIVEFWQERRRFAVPPLPSSLPTSSFRNANLQVRYVGSEACRDCHKDIYRAFQTTPHALSTQRATPQTLRPYFRGRRTLSVFNPMRRFTYVLSQHEGRIYFGGFRSDVKEIQQVIPVHYLVGSGRQGLSLLTRSDDDGTIAQLPVSYYADIKNWGVSPGFQPVLAQADLLLRDVPEKCVVCHATYLESHPTGRFGEEVLGVACEKCHGPCALHVRERQAEKRRGQPPKKGKDNTIVNPRHLPLEYQIEICAECHSKALEPRHKAAYLYRPSLPLSAFYKTKTSEAGKQHTEYESLQQSACWQKAQDRGKLACSRCHSVHTFKSSDATRYVAQCRSCHTASHTCTCPDVRAGKEMDCIACHMPAKQPYFQHGTFRSHRIGIYREH